MTKLIRCQAKNRSLCWKHGTGVGFEANRKIRETIKQTPNHNHPKVNHLLKTMDSEVLAATILVETKNMEHVSTNHIKHAILLASDLHKTDVRSNRQHLNVSPYIEHPLRNTLRLIRLGVNDEATLIGSILHDTVEDHPYEIAKKTGYHGSDEKVARQFAYKYIKKLYNQNVKDMVEGMSNPLPANPENVVTTEEKHSQYRNHVEEAIQNPRVYLGKVSDFVDNALSLHYTENNMSPQSLNKKTTKYLMVIDILMGRTLVAINRKDVPIPDASLAKIYVQLNKGKLRLQKMKNKHQKLV